MGNKDRSEGEGLEGSLTTRIKSLLSHRQQKVTADGLLQRSRSFMEMGARGATTPEDTARVANRKMSRSDSLKNVASNISMRIRRKKSSKSDIFQDGDVRSAPASPAAAAASGDGGPHSVLPPPEEEGDVIAEEDGGPHSEAVLTGGPRGDGAPRSLFRSSSFSSLLHWHHGNHKGPRGWRVAPSGAQSTCSLDSIEDCFEGAPPVTSGGATEEERGRWRHGGDYDNHRAPSTAVGGAGAAGKFRRNHECKGRPCCHVGGSCERLVRRRNKGQVVLAPSCPKCDKCRPWSLDVAALAEEEEEPGGAAKEETPDAQGRSRSLTHIDSLDPSMLVKAAAAAAAASTAGKGSGPSDPDDPTVPLLLDNGGADGHHCGALGPSKHLWGSAELPAPSDRLFVPGGRSGGPQDSKMRRQKLTRSQVSSSEYFSVGFECLDDPGGQEEFVPATKGSSLAEALSFVCSKRGIDLSSVCVYQESAKKPLAVYTTDASRLGGKHLRIKAKEERSPSRSLKGTTSSQSHSRKTSGSYKGYKSGKFFSASAEDPNYVSSSEGPSEASKGPPPSKAPSRQRWSAIFGNNKDTRMDTLAETLDNYSKNGIPVAFRHSEGGGVARSAQSSPADADSGQRRSSDDLSDDDEESLLCLEEDWREVIGGDAGAAQLSERETQQQTAIWELLTTEAAYIRTLKVVTDLFLACLLSLQSSTPAILTEVDAECLFSNIREIHAANLTFWRRHLSPMVREARGRSNGTQPTPPCTLDPKAMKEGFLKFGEMFHPYTKYCGDQSRCQLYCREKIHENELFTAYLAWCETRKECNRLRLQDIVVKPMQRLTKYSLLLKAIQRHTENAADVDALDHMIKAVDEFVNGVNTTLRQRQEQERLRGVIARIEAYDVVETKDDDMEKMVRAYSDLDLTCPMPGCRPQQRRHLLMEADVRLRDHVTSKTDAHVFLFTDMLLVCKAVGSSKRRDGEGGAGGGGGGGGGSRGDGGHQGPSGLASGGVTPAGSSSDLRMFKVIRQPFVVDRLVVKDAPSGNGIAFVYLNEFNMATAAFTLSAPEPKTIKALSESLMRARDQFARAKSKARSEESEEAVAAALAAATTPGGHHQPLALTPSRHAPKLSALTSPYDSAGSTCCCLCFYEDSPQGSTVTGNSGGPPLMGAEGGGGGLLPSCPRSPRCGSSRGSRLSSLAHSHSGSMEMAEGGSSGGCSACHSRGVSVETMTDLRGSSLSSDEGSTNATAAQSDSGTSLGSGGPAHRGPQQPPTPPPPSNSAPALHQMIIPPTPTSPRPERRAVLSRSPTPNTLSVVQPYSPAAPSPTTALGATYLGGQSLPNLSTMSIGRSAAQQQAPSAIYLAPPSRSPPPPPINQRGISYPPPSPPRSLRRSHAVMVSQQSQQQQVVVVQGRTSHPPLTKTRHVGSLLGPPGPQSSFAGPTTLDEGIKPTGPEIDVPVIGGVMPPSNEGSSEEALLQEREDSGVVCGEGSGSEVMDAWCPANDVQRCEMDVGGSLAAAGGDDRSEDEERGSGDSICPPIAPVQLVVAPEGEAVMRFDEDGREESGSNPLVSEMCQDEGRWSTDSNC